MRYIFQQPSVNVQPTGQIQPQATRRPGHYGVHDRTIQFGGGRSRNAFSLDSGPIQRALMRSLRIMADRRDQEQRNAMDDYAMRIANEPREAKWQDMRGDIEAGNQQLQAMEALGIENPQAIIGEQQYGQPIGPEPRKTLGQLWESDPRHQEFMQWKQTRPTHPGLDKQFFDKDKRNFDMYRGS